MKLVTNEEYELLEFMKKRINSIANAEKLARVIFHTKLPYNFENVFPTTSGAGLPLQHNYNHAYVIPAKAIEDVPYRVTEIATLGAIASRLEAILIKETEGSDG